MDQLETNNDLQWQDICWLGDSDDYKPDVIASYDYDNNYQFVQDIIDINQ
ncbi:MAG: hypothetical protein H6766_04145 [Candidatus Peribacteria bacterium]|nr:MAG: hypothetical protein H6766_04145 [Candidatus Peribacteria bacterium]